MKERRIAAGRQLSYYEAGYPAVTTPGAGAGAGGGGHAADRRASRSRTRERDSVLSTSNLPQRDSSVEGYFSNPAQSPYLQPSLAPSIAGYEDSLRSRSEAGSVAGEDDKRYDDEDDANSAKHGSGSTVGAAGEIQDPFEGSVAGSVLREPSGGAREDERMDDEDEDEIELDHDEEDVDDEDVELTLKDRQDVSPLPCQLSISVAAV